MMDMVCNLFVMTASMIYIYKEIPLTAFPPFSIRSFSPQVKSVSTQTPGGDTDYTMLFD
jgi:hypothetical protein